VPVRAGMNRIRVSHSPDGTRGSAEFDLTSRSRA
jgi:hypothetical protein